MSGQVQLSGHWHYHDYSLQYLQSHILRDELAGPYVFAGPEHLPVVVDLFQEDLQYCTLKNCKMIMILSNIAMILSCVISFTNEKLKIVYD